MEHVARRVQQVHDADHDFLRLQNKESLMQAHSCIERHGRLLLLLS